ncbi:MAG: SPFH domain-containing protein [Planctomycetaceae bacterium]|nr:SPFH domain-containing protein [Planctomycetaceae bacterium]
MTKQYETPSEAHQGMMEVFLVLLFSVLFPPILLFGFFVVNPREEIVVLRFGKYVTTLKTQGIRWSHPVGRTLHRISTRDTTLDIAPTTVVEVNGNPIEISAVVVYRVTDTYKAALHVEDHRTFITDQAGAVVKRVASRFPYESADPARPCLKKESDEVTAAFIADLQDAVDPAGIQVLGVRLNDLTYAPEIAQAMLMRQQAMALIDARKTIVEGAVEIVRDAVDQLQAAGLEVDADRRDELVSNLLVVICSGERPQPVLQVQSGSRTHGRKA